MPANLKQLVRDMEREAGQFEARAAKLREAVALVSSEDDETRPLAKLARIAPKRTRGSGRSGRHIANSEERERRARKMEQIILENDGRILKAGRIRRLLGGNVPSGSMASIVNSVPKGSMTSVGRGEYLLTANPASSPNSIRRRTPTKPSPKRINSSAEAREAVLAGIAKAFKVGERFTKASAASVSGFKPHSVAMRSVADLCSLGILEAHGRSSGRTFSIPAIPPH